MRSGLLLAVLVLAVLAMLPPFFTHGRCTAEFEAASARFEHMQRELGTASRAQAYLTAQAIPFRVQQPPPCVANSPTDILSCPDGPKLYASLPVKNPVCRFYRDDHISIQLNYNNHRQLIQIVADMKPYRTYRLELINLELYWAR